MINTDLPLIRPDAPSPEFSDAAECGKWLKSLPLTNIQLLQPRISEQIERLSQFPLSALERLKILEQMRGMVAFLAGELGKKYRNKPVPFTPLEQAAWNNEQALWKILGTGYRQCLQAHAEGDAGVAAFAALITQRAMSCIVAQMLGYGHAYRPAPPSLWRLLHALYSFSEEQGVAGKRIKDGLNHEDGTNACEATYVKALLLNLADPQQLTSRQLLQLDRWLDKWAARTPLSMEQPPTPTLPLVAVDLAGECGPAIFTGQVMSERRFLDTERTAMSLRKRIKFLRNGGNPAEVGLGEDCVQPGCETLLTALYRRWCEVPLTRAHNRRSSEGEIQVCFAFPAIYFFLNEGTAFKQPGQTLDVPPEIMQDMRMFGRVTERTEKLLIARLGFTLESWSSHDQSEGGLKLSRTGTGERISQNQVIALRSSGGGRFSLAVVRWLKVDEDGVLSIGTRVMPGVPAAVAARQVMLNPADMGPFAPAFQLSEIAGQKEAASLVLPVGWFQPGKRIQIYSSVMETAKLVALLEKGANFERVAYVSEPLF